MYIVFYIAERNIRVLVIIDKAHTRDQRKIPFNGLLYTNLPRRGNPSVKLICLFDFSSIQHVSLQSLSIKMTLRGDNRRPPNTLTIHPPSPGGHRLHAPRITTPISQIIPHIISPRKAPLPPSPTHSSHSGVSGLSAHDVRARKGSFDVPNGAPPVPKKEDKRLPGLPFHGLHLPRSPRKRGGGEELHGQGAGMYDNKLVSHTFGRKEEARLMKV